MRIVATATTYGDTLIITVIILRNLLNEKKISAHIGYRTVYAYPETHHISNTKIKQSISDEHSNDKKIRV